MPLTHGPSIILCPTRDIPGVCHAWSLLNSRDKTAWLLEISNGPVKKVITEAKATGGFANPGQRGGTPYEQSGCASAEAVAAIHGSVYSLQHKNPPVPTTVPKILREIAKEKYKDDEGELLKLTPKMIHRLLHLCGYIWGAATEHHVAKLTKPDDGEHQVPRELLPACA